MNDVPFFIGGGGRLTGMALRDSKAHAISLIYSGFGIVLSLIAKC